MPSLQVRNLPDHVYHRLQEKAKSEHRSLAREAVVILAEGLNASPSNKNRRKKLLYSIAQNTSASVKAMTIDPVSLIREDRQR
jgi:plasmid stability protein